LTVQRKTIRPTLLNAAIVAALAPVAAAAQEAAAPRVIEIEQIVVTGTRVPDRSATETAVPVDVVSGEAIANVGVTEINQALSVMLPSFNFPRPGLADGTDTIRPASLRGLSPDQTLVLMNSKRRHASSLVNVNGTIGRGAAAVDLNTIPAAIVQSIEVLRDGASAQYGSDAIAGVINVRLKQDREGGDLMVAYGARDFDYDIPVAAPPAGATWPSPTTVSNSGTDGEALTVSGWKGLGFGDSGFLTLAAEYKDQEHTERGGYDFRQQYPLVAGAFDPREAGFNRFNAWYGEPEMEQLTFFRERRRRARRRRIPLRLGELSRSRIAFGGLLPARARRSQRHSNLSERIPADHRARRHRLERGRRRDLGCGRLGPRRFLDVRLERDAVRRRGHAESLHGHRKPDDLRRGRLQV
jgi:iron complex outermembrane receptor protein